MAVKILLNLRDEKLKTITHIEKILYIHHMVTKIQNSIIDTYRKKRKESKH